MAAKEMTAESIVREIRAGDVKPVYYLMGEESYYIDKVADFIVSSVLKPEERDFNMITFFGSDTNLNTVVNAAKGFPMGAGRLVVMVKESQNLGSGDKEPLLAYLRHVQPTTVLVFCHKNGTLDRRSKLAAAIQKTGVLFESKKLRDYQLPAFIESYLKRKKVGIDRKATEILAQFVGADLSRLAGEMDKLILSLPKGQAVVSADTIERNIGVSKEYNTFELRNALVVKDVLKANRIVKYFDETPKLNPLVKTLPLLFSFFQNLMLSYYAPSKTEQGICEALGLRTPWQAKDYLTAMRNYSGVKVMQIISALRRADAKSKGVDNASMSDGDILRELVFFILH